jgi:hypothetical protein
MFDNIAVLSGNGSADRVVAACGIGPISSNWHPTRFGAPLVGGGQKICQEVNELKKLCFFSRRKLPVNSSVVSCLFGMGDDSSRRSGDLSNLLHGGHSADRPPFSTNL